MMLWLARSARSAFFVALVFAIGLSANSLLESTRTAPSAATRSSAAITEVDGIQPDGVSVDADLPADQVLLDEPVDLSPDLVDADQPSGPSADVDPEIAADSPDLVDLVAPASSDPSLEQSELAAKAQFKRIEIARVSYGTGADSVGISLAAERRPIGPASFAVDKTGTIYVSDNVNGRIQVYSAQGKHLRSMKVDTNIYDLAAGEAAELYVLGNDGSLQIEESATGKAKTKWGFDTAASDELGKLRVAGGQLSLDSPRQVTFPLASNQGQGMRPLSGKEQESGQKKGVKTGSQDLYSTSYRNGGHLYRLDEQGKTVQDIALGLPDLATVVFLQEDRSGNVYVQVERVSDGGQVSAEVRQYSKAGGLSAVVPLDRVDYLQMTRSIIVTDDGVIYQLVPTKQGIALVKYQRS